MSSLPWLLGFSMMATAASMPFYENNPVYPAPAADGVGWDSGTPESAGLSIAWLEAGAKKLAGLPQSRSFVVAHDGRIVFERYFHGATAHDSYNVHSASKSLLGALVGIAVQRGLLHLDDRLGELLGAKFRVPADKRDVTVRHLLSMTSGIRWTEDETESRIEKTADWVQAILDLPRAAAPGKKFNYSTGNTHLLSAILTEASGMPLDVFANRFLYGPLGVTVEHWGHDPQGYRSGGYNFYVTPRELLKLGRLFLDGGSELVPASWITVSWAKAARVDDDYDYGFLWWLHSVRGRRVKKMWGYGGQFVYVVPSKALVVVLTADTRQEHDELDGDAFLGKYVLR